MCILGPYAGRFVMDVCYDCKLYKWAKVRLGALSRDSGSRVSAVCVPGNQFVMDECYDCELYEWTKVDLSDAAQKERVSQYFEEPDEIDGLVLQEAKCFK
ncbi:unnamed protein product [Closterium sp. NIES-53]